MDIGEIGKNGLISRLTEDIKHVQPSTWKGIGDDAAIMRCGDTALAITTDTLIEGIHFDLTYVPLQHLGYKAATAGFSDLYAMNTLPRQLLVSIAVSAKFSVEALERLYQGIKHACERHHADLTGGDITPSVTGLAITVTAIGEANPAKVTYRNTAQKNDLICVSGDLGAAYMGLQILEREKKLFNEDITAQPQLDGYSYIIERQLKPEARKDIIEYFARAGIKPTAMIDISGGMSSELLRICSASGAGCEIHSHRIPVAGETAAAAREFSLEPPVVALNGGADYELLFTVPLENYDRIMAGGDISIIGYVTEQNEGCHVVTDDGARIELK